MSRIVIPTSTDWLTSADFTSGTLLVDGRLAEMLHPELFRDAVGAWAHALDPQPHDYSGYQNRGLRVGITDGDDAWNFTTNLRIAIADAGNLDFGTATLFSAAGWVRTASTATQTVIGKANIGVDAGWTLIYNTTINAMRLTFGNGSGQFTTYDGSTDIADGGWHHVAFTVSSRNATPGANDAEVYVDGVAEGTINVNQIGTNTDMDNTVTLRLGVRVSSSALADYWIGGMDDLFLHRRALSAQEAQQLALRRNIAYECRLQPRRFFFN